MDGKLIKQLQEDQDKILPKVMYLAHYGNGILGIWWYDFGRGELEFSSTAKNHNEPGAFKIPSRVTDDNNLLRGRVIKEGNAIYLVVYTGYCTHIMPETLWMELKYKLDVASGIKADYVVNDAGRLLYETKIEENHG